MNAEQRLAYKRGYDLIDWSQPLPALPQKTHIPPARANLACPMIANDNMEREAWGPDGKAHTSKASLRASYKPSGNPMGNSYIEVGNEAIPDHRPKPASDASIDNSIRKALAQAGAV